MLRGRYGVHVAEVRLTLKPGARGTKKLAEKYGDALVAVRYRYDRVRRRRFKTVELVIDDVEWAARGVAKRRARFVLLRTAPHEKSLEDLLRIAGARWNTDTRVWEIHFDHAKELGLGHRIIAARQP